MVRLEVACESNTAQLVAEVRGGAAAKPLLVGFVSEAVSV